MVFSDHNCWESYKSSFLSESNSGTGNVFIGLQVGSRESAFCVEVGARPFLRQDLDTTGFFAFYGDCERAEAYVKEMQSFEFALDVASTERRGFGGLQSHPLNSAGQRTGVTMKRYSRTRDLLVFSLCGSILASTMDCSASRPVDQLHYVPADEAIEITTQSGREHRFQSWRIVRDSLLLGINDDTYTWIRIDSLKTVSRIETTSSILKTAVMVVGISTGIYLAWYFVRAARSPVPSVR